MNLHYESVSDTLLIYLQKMMKSELFKDFRLVGGTALSLQRGHRRSIDIDLFTDVEYGTMPISEIKGFFEKEFPIHDGTDSLTESALGYHIRISDGISPIVKVDIFYTDSFIFPYLCQDGLRLADEREIAAMKISAITGPIKRQKDYWDIHEMLDDYSIKEMIEWSLARYPYSLSQEAIIEGFESIEQVEESPEGIDSLKPLDYWELKIMDLQRVISKYKDSLYKAR